MSLTVVVPASSSAPLICSDQTVGTCSSSSSSSRPELDDVDLNMLINTGSDSDNLSSSPSSASSSSSSSASSVSSSSPADITASSSNVDDALTSLSWLQNLNMCMTRLGAPTPPTPPASPLCSGSSGLALPPPPTTTTQPQPPPGLHFAETFPSLDVNILSHQQQQLTTTTTPTATLVRYPNTLGNVSEHSLEVGGTTYNFQLINNNNTLNNNAAILTKLPTTVNHNNNNTNINIKSEPSANTKKRPNSQNVKSAGSKSLATSQKSSPALSIATTSSSSVMNCGQHSQLGSGTVAVVTAAANATIITGGEMLLTAADYREDSSLKPPYSYATLICMAMKANKNKMALSSIYKWIKDNFVYYRNADPSWQNSIRHNLSLNKCFIKIPRSKDEPGKGGFWKLDPDYADTLVDGVFKKRRTNNTRPNEGGGNETSCKSKKKSRKKPAATSQQHLKLVATTGAAAAATDTPPSSTESFGANNYGLKKTSGGDNELATAVSSIDGSTHHSHQHHHQPQHLTIGCTTYTLQPATNGTTATGLECDQSLCALHNYTNEVCLNNNTNNNGGGAGGGGGGGGNTNPAASECMIESDGNDICWNTIITEADLNELINPTSGYSVAQLIPHHNQDLHQAVVVTSSANNANNSITTTAQLRAVEPSDLDLISCNSAGFLDDPQSIFYHSHQPSSFSMHGNIISATDNVVTCLNDPIGVGAGGHPLAGGQWNEWSAYDMDQFAIRMTDPSLQQPQQQADDLILGQVVGNTAAANNNNNGGGGGLQEVNQVGYIETPLLISSTHLTNLKHSQATLGELDLVTQAVVSTVGDDATVVVGEDDDDDDDLLGFDTGDVNVDSRVDISQTAPTWLECQNDLNLRSFASNI